MLAVVLLGVACTQRTEVADPAATTPCPRWFVDADADGFGADASAVRSCEPPRGRVATGGDCDDNDPDVHPTQSERCDGVDNDCDGTSDVSVPGTFASISEAVEGVSDDTEVCVQPGAYATPLVVRDKRISLRGTGDPNAVVLNASLRNGPLTYLEGGGLHLINLTVSGAGVGTDIGVVFDVREQSTLQLEQVVVRDFHFDVRPSSDTFAGLIRADESAVMLRDVTVDGIAFQFLASEASNSENSTISGGLVDAHRSTLDVANLEVRGFEVRSDAEARHCEVYGGLIQGNRADLNVQGLGVYGAQLSVACTSFADIRGALVDGRRSSLVMRDAEFVDVAVLAKGNQGAVVGLVSCHPDDFGQCTLRDVLVQGADLIAEGDGSWISGAVTLHGSATVEHLTGWGNLARAGSVDGNGGTVCGSVLCANPAARLSAFRWLDLRNNRAEAGFISGGAASIHTLAAVGPVLAAGNVAGGPDSLVVHGGALHLSQTVVEFSYFDLVGNVAEGEAVGGGALSLEGLAAAVHHGSIVGNQALGDSIAGGAVAIGEETEVEWTSMNVFGNVGEPTFSGFDDPTGLDGNVSVDPQYADWSGADPTRWDLTLTPTSPLVDVGASNNEDADGSPADIGAYGGPHGAGW